MKLLFWQSLHCAVINLRKISILDLLLGTFKFRSRRIMLLQAGLMDDRFRETEMWSRNRQSPGYQAASWPFVPSLTDLCSKLLSIDHSPSVPISFCPTPLCFSMNPSAWRPICIGSTHQSLQSSICFLQSSSTVASSSGVNQGLQDH